MKHKVCVIGGMNLAVISKIDSDLQNDSSLFGEVKVRFGGVARNIVLNLAKYDDLEIDFITVLSNDMLGILAQKELDLQHINYDKSFFVDEWKSYYCETITKSGHYGINDMRMITILSPSYIESIKTNIENHDILVIDANINQETLEYLVLNLQIPMVCDATSDQKCCRIIGALNHIDTIKMNYKEACKLSGLEPKDEPDIERLKSALQRLPLRSCYVTLGEYGSFYLSQREYYYQKTNNEVTAKNVLGAGDAFCAGIVEGILNKMSIESILKSSTNAAENHLIQNNKLVQKPGVKS
jgi:pseudouridine kinase